MHSNLKIFDSLEEKKSNIKFCCNLIQNVKLCNVLESVSVSGSKSVKHRGYGVNPNPNPHCFKNITKVLARE
jgi:hypothetical protein